MPRNKRQGRISRQAERDLSKKRGLIFVNYLRTGERNWVGRVIGGKLLHPPGTVSEKHILMAIIKDTSINRKLKLHVLITRSYHGVVKFLEFYIRFWKDKDVMVSSQWRKRFYGAPAACICIFTEFYLATDCAPTECSWGAKSFHCVFTARSPRVHHVLNAPTACTRRSYSWVYKRRLLSIIDQFLLIMTRKRSTKPRLTSPLTLDQNRCNATQTDPNPTPSDKNPTPLDINPTPLDINPRPSPRPVRHYSPCSMSSRESSLSNPSTSHVSLTQPQKKAKTTTDLTDTQEENMASWLEVNNLIYNKKLNA